MRDEEIRTLERQASTGDQRALFALERAHARVGSAAVVLRPYQTAAADAVLERFAAGIRRAIVNLPTGTGKTVFGFALAKRMDARVCWLAHRDELLRQPLATAERVWPEVDRGLVQASRSETNRKIVVASVQTLAREQRIEQLNKSGAFGLLVVDECHHVASPTYRRVLEGLGAFAPGGPPTLGLTATLERADGVGLGTVFEEIAYQLTLAESIDKNYLAPYVSRRVELPLRPEVRALVEEMLGRKPKRPAAGCDVVQEEQEDVNLKAAERALLFAGVAEATAAAIAEHAADRKTIVFTCTIEQATRTAAELVKLGIRAEHVSGLMPPRDRQGVLERLHRGETRVVCNAQVLTEGFDEPSLDCVVVARPTRSRSLYVQMVGRGLRLYPTKRDCLILDVVFASDLGLQTAANLASSEPTALSFGAGGGARERDPETAASEEEKRVLAVAAATLGEGSTVDGRRERTEGVRWLTVTPTCWALSLWPSGTLVVDRLPQEEQPAGGDSYEAFMMPKDPKAGSIRVSDPGPFEWVFGLAEDYLRNGAGQSLSRPGWRRGPAREAQLVELARRGLPPARSAGEAADTLTISSVRNRLGY